MPHAEYRLGCMYEYGEGVRERGGTALKSGHGNAYSMHEPGLMYYYGWGVTQSKAAAYRRAVKARNSGCEFAQDLFDLLEN